MNYTVGLDFGTHQTKVCIEDASNPAQKIYEFFEFQMPNGDKTVFLPSIVQINKDDTLSYGFVDKSQCKTITYTNTEKPILELPLRPELTHPLKPVTTQKPPKPKIKKLRGTSIKEQLLYQYNFPKQIEEWEQECERIDIHNRDKIEDWELECKAIKIDYDYDLNEYNSEVQRLTNRYKAMLKLWESDNLPQKQIFRYFKLATFSSQFWKYKIEPKIISVWYITFVLFKLQDKFGNEFYTQMGIPSSIIQVEAKKHEKIAYKILIAANILISKYKTLDNFLKAKYTELLQQTEFFECNEQDLLNYGLNIIPEAFAGLSSVTQQRRLERGMHLLVDIGGGTSDIAFFTITENALPNIHAVVSFPLGLNYIFEEYAKIKPISTPKIQKRFRNNQEEFRKYILIYRSHLNQKTGSIIERIMTEFRARKSFHHFDNSVLKDVLKDRYVVYCGGGSIYSCMRTTLHNFTDIRLITKDLLNIPYIKNKNLDESMFTILATSYGLSIQMENEIKITPIENVFDHLVREKPENFKEGSWLQDYDHWLSDP